MYIFCANNKTRRQNGVSTWLRSQQLKQDSYIKCPLAGEIATASLKLKLNVLVDEFSAALFCNLKKYNSFDESW